MKLNYKRTVLVGFAFFLITAFWQAYDTVVPLILTHKFDMNQTLSGFIMSLDNIAAVFLLPIFGALSDRTNTSLGKRTPFILYGTILSSILFVYLGLANNLPLFIIFLLLVLLFMSTFRSPAVALMPDVTPKPLRSKGNAIINLMGAVGGIIVLVLGMIFKTNEAGKTDYSLYLIAVSVLMLVALAIFFFTVKENRWASEVKDDGESEDCPKKEEKKLSKPEFISLILILASVALWYMGYNAVTSKYSVYATDVLKIPYTLTLMIAQGAAIASYIPVGILSSKFGRKKMILVGVAVLTVAFAGGSFFCYEGAPQLIMYILFALAGIGWATINVNSFPMVVELAGKSTTGKYTGYYYTASMAAQILTPILSGALIDSVGWGAFFPYAAIFTGLSFVTMFFVKHGDAKPEAKASVLEHLDVEDD